MKNITPKHKAPYIRRTNQTISALTGANLTDPNRADKAIRKFSWEEKPVEESKVEETPTCIRHSKNS